MHGPCIKIKNRVVFCPLRLYHFPSITMSANMIEMGEVKKLYVFSHRNETFLTPANNF
jgi:hypothetical protein